MRSLKPQIEAAREAGLARFMCTYSCRQCGTFERFISGRCVVCNRNAVKRSSRTVKQVKPESCPINPTVLRIHRAFNLAVNRG